eukprot:746012-Hanusia_phi.AAC.1
MTSCDPEISHFHVRAWDVTTISENGARQQEFFGNVRFDDARGARLCLAHMEDRKQRLGSCQIKLVGRFNEENVLQGTDFLMQFCKEKTKNYIGQTSCRIIGNQTENNEEGEDNERRRRWRRRRSLRSRRRRGRGRRRWRRRRKRRRMRMRKNENEEGEKVVTRISGTIDWMGCCGGARENRLVFCGEDISPSLTGRIAGEKDSSDV